MHRGNPVGQTTTRAIYFQPKRTPMRVHLDPSVSPLKLRRIPKPRLRPQAEEFVRHVEEGCPYRSDDVMQPEQAVSTGTRQPQTRGDAKDSGELWKRQKLMVGREQLHWGYPSLPCCNRVEKNYLRITTPKTGPNTSNSFEL